MDKAPEAIFGKMPKITHDGKTIFKKIENPFQAGMHSLMVGSDIPYVLEVSARNENDAVMAVRHKEHFVEGVQFNPESILTPAGSQIIDNLLGEIKK